MAGRTVTQLTEEIDRSLLSESHSFSVELQDQNGDIQHLDAVEVTNPYEFDYSRLVPGQTVMDIDRFIEVIRDLVNWAQNREGIEENKRVKVISEYPEASVDMLTEGKEVITWKIICREPAMMDSKGTGRPQRKALDAYEMMSPYRPNKIIHVCTRPLDHTIEFVVWSKHAETANKRVMWLERLLITHDWVFKTEGADRFFFERRGSDNYRTTGGQPIYERPLRFKVRLFEFQVICTPAIRHFKIGQQIN